MGAGAALPVCTSVISSKLSSSVPTPPGSTAKPADSFMSMSLRVKKYFIVTSRGSAMYGLASCSNGSRMFTPMVCSRPAPSDAACMMPAPAPVTTIHPRAAIAPASWRACAYSGSAGKVRADPNTVTLGIPRSGANTLNA